MERAKESDLDELIPLVNAAFHFEIGNSGRAFKCVDRIPTRDKARNLLPDLYILRESGEIIGSVHSPVKTNEDGIPESVYIGMLTVKPSCQGKGIGEKILSFSESLAPVAKMCVAECNDDLFPYYKKRGYVETGIFSVLEILDASELTRPEIKMITLEKRTSFTFK